MKKTHRTMLVTLMLCAVFFGAFAAAEEADPAAVRVGEVSYPLSLVQFAVDPYADAAAASDETLTEERKQEILRQTEAHFIGLGVIENKLRELGKNDFTEDEMDILRSQAAFQYEQTWQQIYRDAKQYSEDITQEEITSWMTEKGYTQDAFLRELLVSERESRILDLYCSDVTVTDEEAETYYREQFLEPDKERYGADVPLYEEEILLPGRTSFYVPEGYRYIKNILLAFPEKTAGELSAIEVDGKKALSAAQKAYDKLARAAAAGQDQTELKADYDKKMEAVARLEDKYREKEKEAIPLLSDTIAAIREQLAAGISIETLLQQYSLDQQQTGADKPGALYHPESVLWPPEAHAVIDAVAAPGGLSEPYCDQLGVHLVYYAGNAPGGERELLPEERVQLQESALYYAQLQKLDNLIDSWLPAYEVFTDLSGIRFEE